MSAKVLMQRAQRKEEGLTLKGKKRGNQDNMSGLTRC